MAALANGAPVEKTAADISSCKDTLCHVLGALLALRQMHQSIHWTLSGPNYYGDHQLFGRLYDAQDDDIDTIGEKIVAFCGPDPVEAGYLSNLQAEYIKKWSSGDAIKAALAAEQDFQAIIKDVYDKLEENDELTLGLDDFLMTVADKHETHIYLLQQRLGGK
jgi:DNA-binding ferritin-like protein